MAVVLGGVGLFLYLRLEVAARRVAGDRAALAGDRGRGAGPRRRAAASSGAGTDPLVEQDESFAQILEPRRRVVDSTAAARRDGRPRPGRARTAPRRADRSSTASDVPGIEGERRGCWPRRSTLDDETLIVVVGSSLGDRDEALDGLAKLLADRRSGRPAARLGWPATGWPARRCARSRRCAAARPRSRPPSRAPASRCSEAERRARAACGETLNEMLGRLEEALERERRFVDDASHELRTPLALHKTELELALLHAADEDELRAAIASATDEIDRLIALAEQLLVVARNEDGELRDRPRAVRGRGRARGDRAPASPPGPGGPGARSPTRRRPTRRRWRRTGCGSSRRSPTWSRTRSSTAGGRSGSRRERTAPRSSSTSPTRGPGSRTSSSAAPSSASAAPTAAAARGGTGLGLAVVDAIARAHGGSAHARNRADGGADVWIVLPTRPS